MLSLELSGVWVAEEVDGGMLHRDFMTDAEVVLRGWLAVGDDQEALAARILETLARSSTVWELESAGLVGEWRTQVLAGRASEGTYVHAIVRLPQVLVSLSPFDPEGSAPEVAAQRCLDHVTTLGMGELTRRSERAQQLEAEPVRPDRLIPWVLDGGVELTRGGVALDNGLIVVPAELCGPTIRLLAPDHPFWSRWNGVGALASAVSRLAGLITVGALPMEEWVLPSGARYLKIGPHPAAQGALVLPDLRALGRAVFGELEPVALLGARDLLAVVPAEWPVEWKDAALEGRVRRAGDLALAGPLWLPAP